MKALPPLQNEFRSERDASKRVGQGDVSRVFASSLAGRAGSATSRRAPQTAAVTAAAPMACACVPPATLGMRASSARAPTAARATGAATRRSRAHARLVGRASTARSARVRAAAPTTATATTAPATANRAGWAATAPLRHAPSAHTPPIFSNHAAALACSASDGR